MQKIIERSLVDHICRRHVCVESRTAAATTVLEPVRMGHPSNFAPCTSSSNQICGEDQRRRRKPNGSNIVFKCCPGWAQMYKHSRGCNKREWHGTLTDNSFFTDQFVIDFSDLRPRMSQRRQMHPTEYLPMCRRLDW